LPNNKDTEIIRDYDSMTVEELEQQLREAFFYTDQIDELLAEDIEEICEALEKKKPLEDTYSIDEYWARFVEDYAEEFARLGVQEEKVQPIETVMQRSNAKKKNHRSFLKVFTLVAVIVALMLGISVTAGALGYNLWRWIPVWNAEEIYFVRETQEARIITTIDAALTQFGINDPLSPTWLPDGFVLIESKIEATPLFLSEYYTDSEGRYLSILISTVDEYGTAIYQKNSEPPQEYIVDGMIHYIFENSKNTTAVWYTENYSVMIAGNITKEELELMIDSVYGVIE